MTARASLIAAMLLLIECAGQAMAQDMVESSDRGPLRLDTIAAGLEHPWGMVFLPDGRMLVSERPGRMRLVGGDGHVSEPLGGVPDVYARNQGGLLDVVLHPDFSRNELVYFTFSHLEGPNAGTAVGRGRLVDEAGIAALDGVEIIFTMNRKDRSGRHFGSRLAFADDGTLLFSIGDRGTMERAQDPQDHAGSVLRINDDGSVPEDNPFHGSGQAADEIWSWGHRNPQGLAIHPDSGALWEVEHGPRGGDEINIALAGRNYGWPTISYGIDYSGAPIGEGLTEAEGFTQPIHHWDPSISPSGMLFYTGAAFPEWQGDLFVGALSGRALHRLELDGEEVIGEERLLIDLRHRIRDVVEGPDGLIYLLTDAGDGRILRLSPGG